MTTRFKTHLRRGFGAQATIAAGVAALTLAGAAPVVLASTSGNAAVERQDQAQQQQPRERRGPGMRGMRGGPGMEFRGLDLTDDQRAQLRKIREARQPEFKAAGEKLRAARDGMRGLMEADQINEAAIRAKSQEVAAAEAEMAILNAKVRAESMQILTNDQQTKVKEMRSNRQNRAKQRPGRPGRQL